MRLVDDILTLRLSPALARTFSDCLREVASADGVVDERETSLIERLFGGSQDRNVQPEPLEALWSHGELLVRACVHVALADGDYGVEEARAVSHLAHRLGISVHRLAEVEEAAFREHRPLIPTHPSRG